VGAVSLVAIPIVYAPAITNLIEVLEKALSIGGGIHLGLLVSQGMDNDEVAAMEYAIIVADKAIQDAQIAFAGGALERLRTALGILNAEGTGEVALPVPGKDHPYNPGVPTEKNGFVSPKNWNGNKVKSGSQYGYPDASGDVWVPTNPGNAHGGPHWDVQHPDGSHTNAFPK
jgi:hypothetical protein